jgi:hypothetical protein
MYQHRHEGLTFSSHGNLEPFCYYDSGYKQKKLFDKPQYGYVIFWAGVPIILYNFQSERAIHLGLSIQDGFSKIARSPPSAEPKLYINGKKWQIGKQGHLAAH